MHQDGKRSSWVVLDYLGVISKRQRADDYQKMANVLGAATADVRLAYASNRRSYNRGSSGRMYWQSVGDSLGCAVTDTQAEQLTGLDVASWLRIDTAVVDWIIDLKAAGLAVGLLSNAPPELASAIRADPVADLLDLEVFSCDIGMTKPTADVFRQVVDRLSTDPASVLFIENHEQNVVSATAARLQAIHYSDLGRTRAEVSRVLSAPQAPLKPQLNDVFR